MEAAFVAVSTYLYEGPRRQRGFHANHRHLTPIPGAAVVVALSA